MVLFVFCLNVFHHVATLYNNSASTAPAAEKRQKSFYERLTLEEMLSNGYSMSKWQCSNCVLVCCPQKEISEDAQEVEMQENRIANHDRLSNAFSFNTAAEPLGDGKG
jgi:hypothetical protein